MTKGALPVPYIVAMIIAIIVIAVLVYWFFILSGQGGDEAIKATCRSKQLLYCSQWAVCGYNSNCGGDSCRPRKGDSCDFYQLNPECQKYQGQPNGLPSDVNEAVCRGR